MLGTLLLLLLLLLIQYCVVIVYCYVFYYCYVARGCGTLHFTLRCYRVRVCYVALLRCLLLLIVAVNTLLYALRYVVVVALRCALFYALLGIALFVVYVVDYVVVGDCFTRCVALPIAPRPCVVVVIVVCC